MATNVSAGYRGRVQHGGFFSLVLEDVESVAQ